jgi:drug/metabolite transporter, DME family
VAVATGSLGQITRPFAEPAIWPLLLFAGLAGAALPTLLFLTGVRWIGATRTAILAMIEPVVGVGLAAVILGEALQPIQLAGGALVLLAGVILQRVPEGFPHEPPDAPLEPARPVPAPG